VVGVGRVGGAFARGLCSAGWPVVVVTHSARSRLRARRLKLSIADDRALAQAELCLFTVPDDLLAGTIQAFRNRLSPRAARVHCAGALELEALGPKGQGHARGSVHPLCAISDPEDSLRGYSAAITADSRLLTQQLTRMAESLGLVPMKVPSGQRSAYHAGAVLCAGGAVALLASGIDAMTRAGLSERQALRALLPMMRSALDRVEARGLRDGLTGPWVRGDVGVVKAHLKALSPPLARLYRLLSERGMSLLRP